jgi:hypothetical protein
MLLFNAFYKLEGIQCRRQPQSCKLQKSGRPFPDAVSKVVLMGPCQRGVCTHVAPIGVHLPSVPIWWRISLHKWSGSQYYPSQVNYKALTCYKVLRRASCIRVKLIPSEGQESLVVTLCHCNEFGALPSWPFPRSMWGSKPLSPGIWQSCSHVIALEV